MSEFISAPHKFEAQEKPKRVRRKSTTKSIKQIKREAIEELLALHKQDRAKVNSQCDSLINMSTVDKYLRSFG